MKKVLFSVLSLLMLAHVTEAQEKCGWWTATENLYNEHPEAREQYEKNEAAFDSYVANMTDAEKSLIPDTVIIPIVFHVIHEYGSENVSDQVIYESLERLNTDMMALNSDTANVVEDFADIIGNPMIQFRLAQYDEDGICTSGITRHVSALTNIGDDDVKDLPGARWPRDMYLNVWITKVVLEGQAGGYSYYPSTVNDNDWGYDNDGIVVRAAQFGADERTLTHEVGHWLNLRHTWGNSNEPGLASNCNIDDNVGDTPTTTGHSSGCNTSTITCGSLDNMQNYMDYTSCDNMFTEGQATRMRNAANSSLADRNQLWTDENLEATGVNQDPILCAADFEASDFRICVGDEVDFSNMSHNGDTEWTWTFEGADVTTSNEENPSVVYMEEGWHSVSLTAGNGTAEVSVTKEAYIHVLASEGTQTPIEEGFETADDLPNEDWHTFSTDDNRVWQVTTAASASGASSAVLKNYYQDEGDYDILESNAIDLSGLSDVYISFKYAYAKRWSANDCQMRVKISRNCGLTWINKATLKAEDGTLTTANNHTGYFTPESDEWDEHLIDNISSVYLVENFRFRFEFTNGNGNNIYLDDINIYDPATVGINEVNKAALKFTAFPNPVDDQLTLSFNLLHSTDVNAEVFDISGRKIQTLFDERFQVGTNRLEFSTSDWNSGVYFIRLNLEGETFIEKVIKN